MNEVSLIIDGKPVQAEAGATILDAARGAGIAIPTLCYHPDLEPYGGCRLCIVKVEGMRGMPTSCTTQVTEGMKVTTEDDEILQARRVVVRLLLADHPSDCIACRANLDCDLQRLAHYLGVREHGLIPLERTGTIDDSSPVFIRDMNRCVLCAKCVRTCDEVVGAEAIHLVGRGHQSEVGTFLNTGISKTVCESCGECVVRCPTGALRFKEPQPVCETEVKTVCQYCGTGCSIRLGVRRGRVARVKGDRESPVNRGQLCVKGRFGLIQYVNDPGRLTSPLVKRDGRFVQASWDEALDLVAERLKSYRGEEFAAFSSAKVPNEDNYIMQKFTRAVMGTNSVDHCARL